MELGADLSLKSHLLTSAQPKCTYYGSAEESCVVFVGLCMAYIALSIKWVDNSFETSAIK